MFVDLVKDELWFAMCYSNILVLRKLFVWLSELVIKGWVLYWFIIFYVSFKALLYFVKTVHEVLDVLVFVSLVNPCFYYESAEDFAF